MSGAANLQLNLAALLDAVIDIGTVKHDISNGYNAVFGDGSGANQISQIFTDTRTLAASGTEDLDLNGVLVNALGQTVNFTKVRAIIIKAAAGNTNNLLVGGAASNQFATMFGAAAHVIVVRPGGCFMNVAPDVTAFAVTAATGDLLKIANSAAGTPVTYDIIILGS